MISKTINSGQKMFSRAGRHNMMIAISRYHRNTCTRYLGTAHFGETFPSRKKQPSIPALRPPQRSYSRTATIHFKIPDDDDEDGERIIIPGQPEIQQVGFDGLSDEELERMIDEQIEVERQEEAEKFVPDWRPGMRKRPLQMHYRLEEFEYELYPERNEPVSFIFHVRDFHKLRYQTISSHGAFG